MKWVYPLLSVYAKAEQTDRKVQNLASYINVEVLKEIHEAMDGEKATEIRTPQGQVWWLVYWSRLHFYCPCGLL